MKDTQLFGIPLTAVNIALIVGLVIVIGLLFVFWSKRNKQLFGSLTAVDIALTAGLAAVIGLLFTFWSNVVAPITGGLGPFGTPLIYGFWFLGGVIPAYIIRKPGVAFLGEFIAAHISIFTGSQYGWWITLYGFGQGMASEIAFMLFMYKRWDILTVLLSGALAAIPAFILDTYYGSYTDFALPLRLAILGVMFMSGAVFAFALGKLVVDQIATTGILDNFRIRSKKYNMLLDHE